MFLLPYSTLCFWINWKTLLHYDKALRKETGKVFHRQNRGFRLLLVHVDGMIACDILALEEFEIGIVDLLEVFKYLAELVSIHFYNSKCLYKEQRVYYSMSKNIEISKSLYFYI